MDKKELFQIQNILETLVDATDHFAELIKEKELNQSIFMLSSIVEGCQSTFIPINEIHEDLAKQTKQIENHLLLIAQEIEKSNFIKVSEVVQFSLRPGFNNLLKMFIAHAGNQKEDKVVSIGVFHSWANPREFSRSGRIKAMNEEAKKQSAKLYYFTSKDIDFENKKIEADTFENDEWKRVTVPYPDVINNTGAGQHSFEERKLRREIPFTSFFVGNKYSLPRRMVKHKKYADLLVPFTVCFTEKNTNRFIDKHNKFVFKALASNRGENIYFVTKVNNRYILLDQHKKSILSEEAFQKFLQDIILAEKGSYIIQKYIHTRTKSDEPYHIRAQVQKDKNGEWVITLIYASIGSKETNLSNLSAGGRNESLELFLINEYGESGKEKYYDRLHELALNIAKHLDHLYNYSIEELGIDLAIDDEGEIWMHEANNGPVTRFYEEERAVHTIGYAKYIAQNGIMYTELQSKRAVMKGQFDASNTELPIAINDKSMRVGMLSRSSVKENLTNAFENIAQDKDIQFFYFMPKDIDYDFGLIRAKFYEDGKWTQKVTEYPDVIVDQYKMRGHKDAENIYRELENILFVNTLPIHQLNRLAMLNSVKSFNTVSTFERVTRTRDVFRFLEEYKNVLLYSNKVTAYKRTYTLSKVDKNKFILIDVKGKKEFTELTLRHHLNHLLEDEELIVQKDSRFTTVDNKLISIQINLLKNNAEWSSLNITGILEDKDSTVNKKITIEELYEIYPHINKNVDINAEIRSVSKKIAKEFDGKISASVNELYMELSIDEQLNIEVMDINPVIRIEDELYSQYATLSLQHAKAIFEKRKLTF